MQHLFLQRDVNLLVRIARSLLPVIEGKQERVCEKNPGKTLGIEVVSHGGAIGDGAFDVQFVENIGEVSIALRLLQLRLFLDQPFHVLGRQIVVRIAEQRLGGGDEFRIAVALA